jgi:hypothetical protein
MQRVDDRRVISAMVLLEPRVHLIPSKRRGGPPVGSMNSRFDVSAGRAVSDAMMRS